MLSKILWQILYLISSKVKHPLRLKTSALFCSPSIPNLMRATSEDGQGLNNRVSHLHFFWIFILFQAGMNARHTKEQEKYRSSMLYVHNFFLILTFVSYKLRLVAVDKGYSSEIDFEVIKVMSSHCLLNI